MGWASGNNVQPFTFLWRESSLYSFLLKKRSSVKMTLEPPFNCVRIMVTQEPKSSWMEEFCGHLKLDLVSLTLGKPLWPWARLCGKVHRPSLLNMTSLSQVVWNISSLFSEDPWDSPHWPVKHQVPQVSLPASQIGIYSPRETQWVKSLSRNREKLGESLPSGFLGSLSPSPSCILRNTYIGVQVVHCTRVPQVYPASHDGHVR